jgi:hypothetical protein
MLMKIVFSDNTWFIGKRGLREIGFPSHETKGTHHFTVTNKGTVCEIEVGDEVAVPITSAKFFILNINKA